MRTELFKAADREIMWTRFGVGLFVDIGIAAIIANWDKSEYSNGPNFMTYVAIVAVIWVLQFLLWVKGALSIWVSTKFEHAPTVTQFLEALRTTKIPAPKQLGYSARFDYLAAMADDERVETNSRVMASALFSSWTAVMKLRGFGASLIINRAWDEAITRYNAESPNTPILGLDDDQFSATD